MKKALAFCAVGVIGLCCIIGVSFKVNEASGRNVEVEQEPDVIINQNQKDSSSIHDLEKYISSGEEEYGEPVSAESYND